MAVAAAEDTRQLSARLAAIADLIRPCPLPGPDLGYQLCEHRQFWPCDLTLAAWIARGLDPLTQVHAALVAARRALNLSEGDDDPYGFLAYQADVWLDLDPADMEDGEGDDSKADDSAVDDGDPGATQAQ